jgi:hypothetical protein
MLFIEWLVRPLYLNSFNWWNSDYLSYCTTVHSDAPICESAELVLHRKTTVMEVGEIIAQNVVQPIILSKIILIIFSLTKYKCSPTPPKKLRKLKHCQWSKIDPIWSPWLTDSQWRISSIDFISCKDDTYWEQFLLLWAAEHRGPKKQELLNWQLQRQRCYT